MATHYNYSSLQLYNSLQPVFGVATTPRIGYYKIQSVITIDDSKEVLFLSLWKLRFNEEFQNINQVFVDTEIFEFNATINASVDITRLVGCTINVRASYFDFLNNAGGLHTCNWSLLEEAEKSSEDDRIYPFTLKVKQQIEEDAEVVELEIANALLDMDEALQAWDDYQDNLFYDLHN